MADVNEGQTVSKKDAVKATVLKTVENYKREARDARRTRIEKNRDNYRVFNLEQNYEYKQSGQSREFLPKQNRAVEQITQFVQQTLQDLGRWFRVSPSPGNKEPILSPRKIEDLLMFYMRRMRDFNTTSPVSGYTLIADAVKSGLLGSLAIVKVDGADAELPQFSAKGSALERKHKKTWRLRWSVVHQENFLPDPSGEGLFLIQEMEVDLWRLKRWAKADPDVYDQVEVDAVQGGETHDEENAEFHKDEAKGHNPTQESYRKRVKLTIVWGTILDDQGDIMFENAVCIIANDTFLVVPPRKNWFWHNRFPYVVAALLRTPQSVWHQALADASTKLNKAINEVFNLGLDGGIMSVFNIKQVRPELLENPNQIAGGVVPGTSFVLRPGSRPGDKVVEDLSTGSVPPEMLRIFDIIQSEHDKSLFTNELRGGGIPRGNVLATEVVEASQSIVSIFSGITKTLESDFIKPLLELSLITMFQHLTDTDFDELEAVLGKEDAERMKKMTKAERFAAITKGYDFEVFGLSETLKQMADFRKLVALLQTISGNEILVEEFQQRHDFGKLLAEIIKALGINEEKIKLDDVDGVLAEIDRRSGPGAAPRVQGDLQSQTPQAASAASNTPQGVPQDGFAQGSRGGSLG